MLQRSGVLVASAAGGGRARVGLLLLASLVACESASRHIQPGELGPGTAAPADAGSPTDGAAPLFAPDAGSAFYPPAPARDAGPPIVFDPGASPGLFLRLPEPAANLPHGEAQRAQLCARGGDDVVLDVFCGGAAPRVTSLSELFTLFKVNPSAHVGMEGFSLAGHSTSLSKRSVSAINPRVIFMHTEYGSSPLLGVAFTRGETVVEFVTRSRSTKELQFYLLVFTLPCNATGGDCAPGELLTSAVEQDWQRVDVYGEEDLKNTPLDCRTCHQPGGPTTAKLLRMQEVETPWTHWFDEQTRGGRALLDDYFAAHGQEALAGIPGALIKDSRASALAAFVEIGGTRMQPNEFLTAEIENDVEASAPNQPADNQVRGQSKVWQRLYQAAQRGEAIPVPYHDVKITEPRKLAAMQQAYAQYLAGALPLGALPDIRDVFPDDPVALAEMGFTLDARLDDGALLIAACGLCHNARLDQNLSRARFHTDLARLSREAKELAIERLSLPGHDVLAMPPRRIHDLSDAVRDRLIALLRR